MGNFKKRSAKRLHSHQFNFDEIDHRLSCGWYAETKESNHKKKYLMEIKEYNKNFADNKLENQI